MAVALILAAALVGVWTDGEVHVQGGSKANDSDVIEEPKPASQVVPSYPGSVPDAPDLKKPKPPSKAEITERWEDAKRIYVARRDAAGRLMDLSSDETPIGEGRTIGEMVRDLFSNTNYLEVARDEVAQSLREVGAGDAAARAEGALSMTELMLVAGEYRGIVETYVDRMYDEAQVTSMWREMFEDRGRFAALDRLSQVYNESLSEAQKGQGR